MPYNVELMALGDDIYPLLKRAAAALNGVQNQFQFQVPSPALRQDGIGFKRSTYLTTDVWDFLRDQRERFGGHRPCIIAFVTKPLKSPRIANLFGAHEGQEGLAVVTTVDGVQYVKEIARYCCYYLVRYTLSFINPHIRAHEEEWRKSCYFHFKRHKPDIRESMDTGHICDPCRARLFDPPATDVHAKKPSMEEREALDKMLAYVSQDLPYAIIMKGGGVKGLAFAGALMELENYYRFDRHVGTSAGAIAAVLLAASYTPRELTSLLRQKNFRDFKDAPLWRIPFNLLWSRGCFPGETCRLWIADLLTSKIPQLAEVPMSALNGALVYAARQQSGTLAFDSNGERKEAVAAFATRCSMSIPFFFFPASVEGRRVYDGGLRNNFPLSRYLAQEPRTNFIALYLGKPDNSAGGNLVSLDLLNIAIDGEERRTVDEHRDKVIVIDTSPVGTVDFNLNDLEKDFLLRVGKAAALKFLHARNFDDGPSDTDVAAAERVAEAGRKDVIQMRSRRRRFRLAVFGLVVLAIAVVWTVH